MTAFGTAFFDALSLVGVELEVVVVEFFDSFSFGLIVNLGNACTYPFIPVHVSQAHGYMVGTMSEWSICIGLCGVDVPIWKRGSSWAFELHRLPNCLKISR